MDNLKRNLDGVFETPKKATLVGPSGERVAVEIDSPKAKNYFAKGFKLETKPQVSPYSLMTEDGSSLPGGSVNTTQENPMMTAYNNLLMDSLKKAQGVDTIELLKRKRDLERKAISARTADVPTGFETMSPSQRNQIRKSNISLIEGDIDENAYQLAKAEKAISNFEDIFFKAQQFGQEFAEKMVLPDSMIENYKKIIEADPSKMTTILATLNDKSKQAVLNSLDYTKLKPKVDKSKYNIQVVGQDPITLANRYGYLDEQGNINYTDGGVGDNFTPGEGMRTDRHNNPIAAAVPTGGTNEYTQALDNAGIKWTYGDKFGDNPDMQTIKILGDSVEGARAILANSQSIQNWYINHTGKKILNEYGVRNNEDFNNLDTDSQNAIIKGIYKAEGGNGSLVNEEIKTGAELDAEMLLNGTPPSIMSKRSKDYNAALRKANEISIRETGKPYDPIKAEIKYKAGQAWARNMNSAQMIRYQGLANSVVNTIDEAKSLAKEMELKGIPLVNKVKLQAYIQATGEDSEQGQIAAKYIATLNTLKEEFANLANGGYAPTDSAWELANAQINENYDINKLNASLTEVQRLINFRTNAIMDVQVNYGNNGSTVNGSTYNSKSGNTYNLPN